MPLRNTCVSRLPIVGVWPCALQKFPDGAKLTGDVRLTAEAPFVPVFTEGQERASG